MNKSILFCYLILCGMIHSGKAQTSLVKVDSLLVGTWKGTSICQQKKSPCHDETVVYHISKKTAADSFNIQANKMVNGVEEDMGLLPFVYNRQTNQLSSTAYGIWNFKIEGSKLEGTLFVRGDLYRKIIVFKVHSPLQQQLQRKHGK